MKNATLAYANWWGEMDVRQHLGWFFPTVGWSQIGLNANPLFSLHRCTTRMLRWRIRNSAEERHPQQSVFQQNRTKNCFKNWKNMTKIDKHWLCPPQIRPPLFLPLNGQAKKQFCTRILWGVFRAESGEHRMPSPDKCGPNNVVHRRDSSAKLKFQLKMSNYIYTLQTTNYQLIGLNF